MHKHLPQLFIGFVSVFALAASLYSATAGAIALGENAGAALAQADTANAAAAVVLAQSDISPTASSTLPIAPPPYCPKLSLTLVRGAHDATTTGQVHELQKFLSNHFGLKEDDVVTGYFGSTTESYVAQFQKEQGLDRVGIMGNLTRMAIARLCYGVGTSTMPTIRPLNDDHAHATSTLPEIHKPFVTTTPLNTESHSGDGDTHRPPPTMLPGVSATATSSTPIAPTCSYIASGTGLVSQIALIEGNKTVDACRQLCINVRNEKFGLSNAGYCIYGNTNGTKIVVPIQPGTITPNTSPTSMNDSESNLASVDMYALTNESIAAAASAVGDTISNIWDAYFSFTFGWVH